MGTLKPDTTYVYERNGDEIYARESGQVNRQLIGYKYDPFNPPKVDSRTNDGRPLHDHIMESKLWGEIHREAKTNPALQKALDRAIMIYRLSKDNPV
jgi:hypothetical protein